jgi:methylated-DNA-[protein]-cysteine S-methyltransferase
MSARGYVVQVPTRQGPFGILADDDGVLASGWGDDAAALLAHVHPSLRPDAVERVDAGAATGVLAAAVQAVRAYDDGTDLDAVGCVPVHTQASAFCQAAWRAMRDIPVGAHVSYAELATRAGRPNAARAAGGACARNPTPLFVPCHRVLRAGGALGGFAYGVPLKQQLLDAEAAWVRR